MSEIDGIDNYCPGLDVLVVVKKKFEFASRRSILVVQLKRDSLSPFCHEFLHPFDLNQR
jgi:hypothetical protein